MALKDKIRKTFLNFLGLENQFVINQDVKTELNEYKVWYIGNSEKLMRFYTIGETKTNNNLFKLQNKLNYFWSLSTSECNIKRVHSGLPKVIIDTLCDVVGTPKISVREEYKKTLDDILCTNDFDFLLTKQQRPMTMVEGYGAYKININRELSDKPLIEFYDGENVEFVCKGNFIQAFIFKDKYNIEEKEYTLLEIRKVEDGVSVIDYELYYKNKKIPLESVKEFAHLANAKIEFKGLARPLAVATRYLVDPSGEKIGYSFFEGKIDLFDDLDQCLSQASQTTRVSTPVEYFNADILGRTPNGEPKLPRVYNRQFIQRDTIPDGDGHVDNDVITTQPQLNFAQYNDEAMYLLSVILTGQLSPATLGIDLAKKDNAEAQREKEKITIVTRNKIINREKKFIKELVEDILFVNDFMHSSNGVVDLKDYEVAVSFDEFATPTFETKIEKLGQAFRDDCISTEKYVELLWGDKLNEQERREEIAKLNAMKNGDDLNLESFEKE